MLKDDYDLDLAAEADKSSNPADAADTGDKKSAMEADSFLNNPPMTNQPNQSSQKGPTLGMHSPTTPPPGGPNTPTVTVDDTGKVLAKGPGGTGMTGSTPDNGKTGGGGLGGSQGGFPGSQGGMGPTVSSIVKASPFLNDHMSFYLASNTSPTDLHALQKVGSNILNPISQQVIGDDASGRTAFDGQSSNLPKDAKRKCSTNFFGVETCQK